MDAVAGVLSSVWVPWLLLAAVFGMGIKWGGFKKDNATKQDIKDCQVIHDRRFAEISGERKEVWKDVKDTRVMVGQIAEKVSHLEGWAQGMKNGRG